MAENDDLFQMDFDNITSLPVHGFQSYPCSCDLGADKFINSPVNHAECSNKNNDTCTRKSKESNLHQTNLCRVK